MTQKARRSCLGFGGGRFWIVLFYVVHVMPLLSDAGIRGIGNGGTLVVCDSGSIELLDYWEAVQLNPEYRLIDHHGKTAREILDVILDQLDYLDPIRSENYRNEISRIFVGSHAKFIRGHELQDPGDQGSVIFRPARECRYEVAIVQNHPIIEGTSYRYVVNQDLYERLSPIAQAGLLLHEVVYREDIGHGAENAVRTRRFVSTLSSPQFKNLTLGAYRNYLASIRFPIYSDRGYVVKGETALLQKVTGLLLGGELIGVQEFVFEGRVFHVHGPMRFGMEEVPVGVTLAHPTIAVVGVNRFVFEKDSMLEFAWDVQRERWFLFSGVVNSDLLRNPYLRFRVGKREIFLSGRVRLYFGNQQPYLVMGVDGSVVHFMYEGVQFLLNTIENQTPKGMLSFEDNQLRHVSLAREFFVSMNIHGQELTFTGELEFFLDKESSGLTALDRVRQGTLSRPARLVVSPGKTEKFSAYSRVRFDPVTRFASLVP